MPVNLIEIQNSLRDLSDDQLVQEFTNPSAEKPAFMVMSELDRRKRLRQSSQAQQPGGTGSVREEMAQGLASAVNPPVGQTGPQKGYSTGGFVTQSHLIDAASRYAQMYGVPVDRMLGMMEQGDQFGIPSTVNMGAPDYRVAQAGPDMFPPGRNLFTGRPPVTPQDKHLTVAEMESLLERLDSPYDKPETTPLPQDEAMEGNPALEGIKRSRDAFSQIDSSARPEEGPPPLPGWIGAVEKGLDYIGEAWDKDPEEWGRHARGTVDAAVPVVKELGAGFGTGFAAPFVEGGRVASEFYGGLTEDPDLADVYLPDSPEGEFGGAPTMPTPEEVMAAAGKSDDNRHRDDLRAGKLKPDEKITDKPSGGSSFAFDLDEFVKAGGDPSDAEMEMSRIMEELTAMQGEMESGLEKDKWLAVAEMGLGIAGGDSPYFAENVGKGAMGGLESLQEIEATRRDLKMKGLGAQADMIAAKHAMRLGEEDLAYKYAALAADTAYKKAALSAKGAGKAPDPLKVLEERRQALQAMATNAARIIGGNEFAGFLPDTDLSKQDAERSLRYAMSELAKINSILGGADLGADVGGGDTVRDYTPGQGLR